MLLKSIISRLFLVMVATLVVSCGGGSGGSENTPMPTPNPPVSPVVFTGTFLDSAVEGLRYATATQSGSTNASGEFKYQANETITFSIGAIDLPPIQASLIISPLDIFSTTDINDTAVVNLSRLLQSLDIDDDPNNGIVIDVMAHTMASGLTLDFASNTFETDVINLVANSGSSRVMLISANAAISHLSRTLNLCGTDHELVGSTASFSTLFHEVSGTAEVINNCTVEITMFNYDGEGPLVYFYGGNNGNFTESAGGFALSDLALNGQVHEGETITLNFIGDQAINDFNSISVWCFQFKISFGDLVFMPVN